jgi:hypothetical protein
LVAHGVNTAVKEVEPTAPHSALDGARVEASREQLRAPDHPVLPAGEGRDESVGAKVAYFGPHSDPNEARLAHDPDRADQNATEHPPSVPPFAPTLDNTAYLTYSLINRWIN